MKLIYSIGVNFYAIGIRIASLWNPKAKKIIQGRKQCWIDLESFEAGDKVYWFHCASLGEFEQGRPVMEGLKSKEECQIVVTFFSPSGYEVKKDYEGADLIVYLPKDSKSNAVRFLKTIQPKKIYFVKYEFWAHFILEAKARKIPIYSISAVFREDQIFFKWYGSFMVKVLESFDAIYVQNKATQSLLNANAKSNELSGDTRFDRVLANASQVKSYNEVSQFCGDRKVLICGSIWTEDLNVISDKINSLNDWKIIVAPHEIGEDFITKIESKLKLNTIRYSKISNYTNEQVLIIDNIGMLMNLYQYGTLAYVGGGFKTGLHNILEPAAFGMNVIFGNKTEKFPEAQLFINEGIGFSVDDSQSFSETFDKLTSLDLSQKVHSFMNSQKGATEIILENT